MIKISYLFIVFLLAMFFSIGPCYSGLFNKTKKEKQEGKEKQSGEQVEKTALPERKSDIPVYDKIDKLIERRQKEAYELIAEGRKLIKKGEKRNNTSLIKKGEIKKEIGEKQLLLLKEQAEQKKIEEQNDIW